MKKFSEVPMNRFALIIGLCALFFLGTIHFATQEAKFNIEFKPNMTLISSAEQLTLEKIDFTTEPGDIEDHRVYNTFFQRQAQIHSILKNESVHLRSDNGETQKLYAQGKLITDLPALFWIQLFVGLGGFIISGWIWALTSKSLPSTLFMLSGLSMCLSAITSAIYTTRMLYVPSDVFILLQKLNIVGAAGFGIAMVGLFLIYPLKLSRWRPLLITETIIFSLWTIAHFMQLTPPTAGVAMIIASLMLLIIIAIGIQFSQTKKDPTSRAVLVWLGLSVLVGAGGWVIGNTIPLILGTKPLDQGYAFISFIIIYLGLAAGLTKYRLFEVGHWAYRFLFYIMGTLLFVALDAGLIYLTDMDRFPALGVALIVVSFLYLPFRDYFWHLFTGRKKQQTDQILAEALHVTLAPTAKERQERWMELLKKLFDPLEVVLSKNESEEVTLINNGLTMLLPPIEELPAIKVSYPWAGSSLFNLKSVQTAKAVVKFLKEAESSRKAYDRGVKEERRRVAQDLHDDVGARLLTGLHSSDSDLRSTIQGAMSDIRSIIKGITGEEMTLSRFIADSRIESARRLELVGITLHWPIDEIDDDFSFDYRVHKALSSVIREIVNNTMKHSKAQRLDVSWSINKGLIEFHFQDDGQGFPQEVLQGQSSGYGMTSLSKRISDLGGSLLVSNTELGGKVSVSIPN